ncbi:hypothetical protein N7481_013091 [Penicillium waksmanii]|uniref:uncharacterized protein n=1 Tax=Penicillium waksmanii TaxID=69791 RepID=UPI002547C2D3|nr:uncharacterized protein N7481_013091 [Penicillium waksmanii]KAJ5966377.1 hypothetical protein N7481_013091 [Penicillium waksmanii]
MPERRLSRLLKAKLLRRSSTPAVPKAGNGADPPVPVPVHVHPNPPANNSRPSHLFDSASEKSPYSVVSSANHSSDEIGPTSDPDRHEGDAPKSKSNSRSRTRHERRHCNSSTSPSAEHEHQHRHLSHAPERSTSSPLPTDHENPPLIHPSDGRTAIPPRSAVVRVRTPAPTELQLTPTLDTVVERTAADRRPSSSAFPPQSSKRPSIAIRRQSLLPSSHQHLITGLLEQSLFSGLSDPQTAYAPVVADEMVQRRIWVKRPGGSATLVPCLEDAVVDELRDQVIMKFANSLGRTWDSPDIVIRIAPREGTNRQTTSERLLSPEESLSSILDTYYPGGQKIEEALLIDAPTRRTPKPSPRHSVYHHHNPEPGEHGEYFPLMPAKVPTPPTHPAASGPNTAPAMSIINNGVAPPLPSPGRGGSRHHRRPPLQRHTTNSPTILGQGPIVSVTVSPRVSRKPKSSASPGAVFGGLIDGTVPPINVLIVEDNIINQKLLEAFMKRLSVRWKCAANGEEAVRKWRQGGFHLVLMDIQLPVMNGLDATKEIRRLERLNGIGVFPKNASGRSSVSSTSEDRRPGLNRTVSEEDTLTDLSLFRSPVIIVALTASSLQSDRHEALAAGCNDFLTKPVGFPWLSQKVTEWGCMQALIDFEGWRKWRGFLDTPPSSSPSLDSAASPMQTGHRNDFVTSADGSTSPSTTRHTKNKPSSNGLPRPHIPDAAELLREDSWGSGSGDTGDSGLSPDFSPDGLPVEADGKVKSNAAPPSKEE